MCGACQQVPPGRLGGRLVPKVRRVWEALAPPAPLGQLEQWDRPAVPEHKDLWVAQVRGDLGRVGIAEGHSLYTPACRAQTTGSGVLVACLFVFF